MNLSSSKAPTYRILSAICFLAFSTIFATVLSLTNPEGKFSYARFGFGSLCWLISLAGTIFAVLAFRKPERANSRLFTVFLITVNGAGAILGGLFFVGGLMMLRLEHRVKQEEIASRTNTTYLAFSEFRSNQLFYTMQYTNAANALGNFNDLPVSSLKSKEFLTSRGISFSNFIRAGTQLGAFYINGPTTFTQKIENSGKPSLNVTTALRNFRKYDLYLWDEQYTVLEKTLQMTSNTLILNNLLANAYDHWNVSNGTIV